MGQFSAVWPQLHRRWFRPLRNGNFLNDQAQGTAFFSKAAFDQNGADWLRENIVSTGPFEGVEWIQDDRAVLSAVAYDHWFPTPEIHALRTINFIGDWLRDRWDPRLRQL